MLELIDQAADIVDVYRKKREQIGLDYNVFTLMDIERREEETHEYMIYSILNYSNPVLRKKFIEQFLIHMGIPKSFLREQWTVEREHYTEKYGRLDLFFKPRGHSKKCVVVELKVDAGDQPRQLKRYEDYVRACGYQDYRIIYLTLDGRDPEEQSYDGMVHPEWLMRKSFGVDVLNWLEGCIEICQNKNVDAGFMQQYWILLKKLTEEDKMQDAMENEIAGLIRNSQDLRTCLGIEQALPVIKGQILFDFMDAIYHAMEKKGCNFYYVDYDCAKDYYDGSKYVPYFECEITNFTSYNKQVTLVLEMGVGDCLYFGFYYMNEEKDVIGHNQFMNRSQRVNQCVEDAISTVFSRTIRRKNRDDILSDCIIDSSNQEYDFKHFSDNCVDLKDKTFLRDEAKRIAGEMMYYIKEIKAILEEE